MSICALLKALRRRFTLGQLAVAVSLVVLVLRGTACGGESKTTTKTRTAPTTTTGTTTTPTSSVSTGPVHGSLTAENHAPVVNKDWRYSLTMTDAAGHPLSETVDIEFIFSGAVVGRDSPRVHDHLTHEIERVNQRFARVEQIKRFAILDRDLTQETGELTPTEKAKRALVYTKFKDVIDALYQ